MDPEQLKSLLGQPESDHLERKSAEPSLDKLRQTICAFANDLPGNRAPGYIILGVDDQGRPTSLPITDELLNRLSNLRSDGAILPVPSTTVRRSAVQGVEVAVIEVQPSDSLPVRHKGEVWVRVGPTTQRASPQDERVLLERQVAGTRTFDQRPCPEASVEDLLLEVFLQDYLPRAVAAEVLTANRREVAEQLATLRFFDLRRGVPTNAGVLVFGRDPLAFLPGAFLQFVRYDGTTPAEPVQQAKTVSGNLITQLLQLDNLIPIQIHAGRTPGPALQRESLPDYPLAAVREFVLNALMHRVYEGTNSPVRVNWFSDKIEVLSPGGLFGQVTPENYERVSDYRNPTLAEVLKVLGYVERFGTGIARAQAALRANGNPPAEFEFQPTHVLVTIGAAR